MYCYFLCRRKWNENKNYLIGRLNSLSLASFRFTGEINRKCVHLRGNKVPKWLFQAEKICQLPHQRSPLAVPSMSNWLLMRQVAWHNGFSVVIQDNYYGDELNRMINYLHKYPVEVAVLLSRCGNNKRKGTIQEKTGYSGFYGWNLIRYIGADNTTGSAFGWTISNQTPQQTAETNARKFGMIVTYKCKENFFLGTFFPKTNVI